MCLVMEIKQTSNGEFELIMDGNVVAICDSVDKYVQIYENIER